jgi:DNA repair protein RadD
VLQAGAIHRDGELIELASCNVAKAPSRHEQINFYCELRQIAHDRGYADGWAYHKFREKFGWKPEWGWKDYGLRIPSRATRGWVQSRQIAFAKRRVA